MDNSGAPSSARRTHLSKAADPIALHPVEQGGKRSGGVYKPAGFWYEVDGDWQRWCQDESWGTDLLQHAHIVDLAECNMLVLDTLAKLDAFHLQYGIRTPRHYMGLDYVTVEIDWRRVAAEHDGLEIAPYQWERRLADEFSWYYGWDCASGVIWRPRNARVTYLGPVTLQAERVEA